MKARLYSLRATPAFTIIELLVSTIVLSLLMLVCVTAVDAVRRSVTGVRGRAQQFREARQAFELITKTLSQATLNPYWDYYYAGTGTNTPPADSTTAPSAYIRQSELQFQLGQTVTLLGGQATTAVNPGHAVFFQAPLGLTQDQGQLGSLLNARGFLIQFSDDATNRPPFFTDYDIPIRHRYRLVEYRPPAERTAAVAGNSIYSRPTDWFRQNLGESTRVVADNIILLVLSPRVSDEVARTVKRPANWIAPRYSYNSLDVDNTTPAVDPVTLDTDGNAVQGTQHLLPPFVTVTMVALEEKSATQWAERTGNAAVDFLEEAGAPFTDAAAYADDLTALETWLDGEKLHYETFSTTVALRNARSDARTF